jgi:hypothetical protein
VRWWIVQVMGVSYNGTPLVGRLYTTLGLEHGEKSITESTIGPPPALTEKPGECLDHSSSSGSYRFEREERWKG